jgi:hypothetical protein
MPANAYDIFVSYAHVDDDPMPGIENGWVSTFVAGLRKELARELGRPDSYSLWMDYELRGNEPLTSVIHGHLSKTKILLLFLSQGYLASHWCRKELEIFSGQVGAEDGRIFAIYVSPVKEVPLPLKDLPMYDFWVNERDGPRTLGHPQPIPTEREYYQGIRRLARELAEKLRGIISLPQTRNGLTVFVNGGELDIELVRATAVRLQEQDCGYVLPVSALGSEDGTFPTSAEEITRDLHDNLESCDAVLLVYREGPRTQVRQYIKEYRKHKARSKLVPNHINLCHVQAKPVDIGIRIPELHIVCEGDTCLDICVEQFLQEHSL